MSRSSESSASWRLRSFTSSVGSCAGQAAEIAGLSRLALLWWLAVTGVPAINFCGSEAEAEAEVEAARDLAE